jgi:flagellar protein FlgJ
MISSASASPMLNSPLSSGDVDSGLPAMPGKNAKMGMDAINKTANDFESMFVSQMLEQMFGDSIGSEAYGDSETSDVYKSMMMDAYGKEINKSGGIGIADYVRTELLKLQEIHA